MGINISNIEEAIKSFAKFKRIKPDSEEFVKFRTQIMSGLGALGLDQKNIDIDEFKQVVKTQPTGTTIGEKWDMIIATAEAT